MPDPVYQALARHIGITKERLATPLNCHPDTEEYWSPMERDQVFGARWDAYKCVWTGSSLAHPDKSKAHAIRALTHAISSAHDPHQPTATLVVLPIEPGNRGLDYQRVINTSRDNCHMLLRLPQAKLPMAQSGPQYKTPSAPKRAAGDYLIVLVGNAQGLDRHSPAINPGKTRAFHNSLRDALNQLLPHGQHVTTDDIHKYWRAADMHRDTRTHKHPPTSSVHTLSAKMKRMPSDTTKRLITANPTWDTYTEGLPQTYWYPSPLKYDWTQFTYTDGSVTKARLSGPEQAKEGRIPMGIGSGVYTPGQDGATPAEQCVAILPMAEDTSKEDTINRAELVPILHAIKQGSKHIATDSLTAMYQIKKAANRPQDLKEHRHQTLLLEIVQAIAQQQDTIHIYKVKSHTGVVGNERADELATAVAKGTLTPQ